MSHDSLIKKKPNKKQDVSCVMISKYVETSVKKKAKTKQQQNTLYLKKQIIWSKMSFKMYDEMFHVMHNAFKSYHEVILYSRTFSQQASHVQ